VIGGVGASLGSFFGTYNAAYPLSNAAHSVGSGIASVQEQYSITLYLGSGFDRAGVPHRLVGIALKVFFAQAQANYA